MRIALSPYVDQLDHIVEECFIVNGQLVVLNGDVVVLHFAFECNTQRVVPGIVGTLADQKQSVLVRRHQLFDVIS